MPAGRCEGRAWPRRRRGAAASWPHPPLLFIHLCGAHSGCEGAFLPDGGPFQVTERCEGGEKKKTTTTHYRKNRRESRCKAVSWYPWCQALLSRPEPPLRHPGWETGCVVLPVAGGFLRATAAAATSRVGFAAAVTPGCCLNRCLYLQSVSPAINSVHAGRPEERGALLARGLCFLPLAAPLASLRSATNFGFRSLFVLWLPQSSGSQYVFVGREPLEVAEAGTPLHCFTCRARAEQTVCAPERGYKAAHVLGLQQRRERAGRMNNF